MAMQTEAKRVKTGQSLTAFDTQATNAINVLKGIRSNLANMKTLLQSDSDFVQADIDEVDAITTKIDTAINNITKA